MPSLRSSKRHSGVGRPSIAPEYLKRPLPLALYPVRTEWAFCEQVDYHLFLRWFLELSLDDAGLDQSNFSRLCERLIGTDVAQRVFDEVVTMAR